MIKNSKTRQTVTDNDFNVAITFFIFNKKNKKTQKNIPLNRLMFLLLLNLVGINWHWKNLLEPFLTS